MSCSRTASTGVTRMMQMNRRQFLEIGAAVGAAALSPRWMRAQATPKADPLAAMRAAGASTPIKTTQLHDNVYLLQGAGGNMAVQTGADGTLLIDSSFATAVPQIREAIVALTKEPASTLINTHWHVDHTDGNAGMHEAGFTIFAHDKTRQRMAVPAEMKLLGISLPAYPATALPVVTFDDRLHMSRNRDSLDLVHFEPAHTDTDIYIHFQNADVLHVGDIWFNGTYPFIDESSGGSIGGTIRADEKVLALAGSKTKIIPGHGRLGTKAELQEFHDMLCTVRDRVAALKSAGASEQEVLAKKPTSDLDARWGKAMASADFFTGIVYRTL